jgi:hypothetical protein
MNHKLFTTLSGLSVTSALLVISMMAPGEATRSPAGMSDDPLARAIDARVVADDGEVVAPVERKQRRRHAALSMPYFSFAQSLRPRG